MLPTPWFTEFPSPPMAFTMQARYFTTMHYYMCPHTTTCVSAYYYKCVLILLYMCPHTTIYTTIYVSSYYYISVRSFFRATPSQVSTYCYTCALILLYMCPHTAIRVLILLYMCPHTGVPAARRRRLPRSLRARHTGAARRALPGIRARGGNEWTDNVQHRARYSPHLLYWYKSTNTDAEGGARQP
jgi:hypothetical protein